MLATCVVHVCSITVDDFDHMTCQVIPLESVMKHPNRMQYVLDVACVVVLAVNLPFAIYGYLLFGSATAGQKSV